MELKSILKPLKSNVIKLSMFAIRSNCQTLKPSLEINKLSTNIIANSINGRIR